MKNRQRWFGILCVLSVFGLQPSSFAQAPSRINYQGRLVSGTNLVNGNVGLSLRLFDVSSGGSSIYEDSNSVTVVDGLYSTFIGDNTTFGNLQSALGNSNVWVEVAVNGVALAPRERIASVPYALNVNAGGIAGTIADANLSANIARLDVTNNAFAGTVTAASFAGNGAALTGISGGSIAAGTITSAALADGAVTSNKLAALAVTTASLVDGAVSGSKIASNTITTANVADGGLLAQNFAVVERLSSSLLINNPAPALSDNFGISVAGVGSTRFIVGAYADDAGASDAGSVYLYGLNGTLLATITNPAPEASDYFGSSVAGVSSNRFIVGAPADDAGAGNAGSVYLYDLNGTLLATITNPAPEASDFFGSSVAGVSSNRFIVGAIFDDAGASDAGSVYLYDLNGTLLATITNPAPEAFDYFGSSVAGVSSNRFIVGALADDAGASDAGSVYLYDQNGTLLASITNPAPAADDNFGYSVAGVGSNRFVVGAHHDDAGAFDAGSVYLYDLNGTLLATITNPAPAANDIFGNSVAGVSSNRFIVGAYADDAGAGDAGSVYLYDLNGTLLTTITNPAPAGFDNFGYSVTGVGSNRFVVGAHQDDAGAFDAGSAYLYCLADVVSGLVSDGVGPNSVGISQLNTASVDARYVLKAGDTVSGSLTAQSFIGNGAGLTNISGASLADGTISNADLSVSVTTNITARLASNAWAAADSTTNYTRRTGDTMSGALTAQSFIGNGAGLTNISGASLADGTISNADLSVSVTTNITARLASNAWAAADATTNYTRRTGDTMSGVLTNLAGFVGNGAGLTNIAGGSIASGTIADAHLSANIARLNGTNQTFAGGVNFSSASNTFTGTFSGNGAGVTNVDLGSVTAISAQPNVIAWGAGTNNLGFGDSFGQSIVPATATEVVAIAGGGNHSLALRGDGTVIAWGSNISGQTNVPATATGVVAVASGGAHSLALRGDGTVIAWGNNAVGQTNVPATATGVVAFAGGGNHSLALRGDGTVIAWGYNFFGQTNVPATATGVVAVAAGASHSLALRGNGTVIAWGDSSSGKTNVPATATGVVAVAAGASHSLALRGDGTVIAWGQNSSGQTNVPATATGVVAVAAGDAHSLVLRSDGTVIAWGSNSSGQTNVPATASGVMAVAAGGNHSLALRSALGPAQLARLDTANNTFAGTVTAAAFVGNGAGLTGITNFVNKVGDTMTGALNLPAGGLTVGANQLVVTPSGNVGIGMASPPHMLDVNATSGIPTIAVGDLNGTNALFYIRANVGSSAAGTVDLLSRNAHDFTFTSFPGGVGTEYMRIKGTNGNVGIGTSNPTNKLHVVGTVQATAYITGSDRNAKENVQPVSVDEILAKVATLPISTWTFKEQDSGTHLGPMAQDFYAAFNLGNTDSGIFTVDQNGVALAAIQGLKKEKDSEIEALKNQNEDLQRQVDELRRLIQQNSGQ